MIGNDVSPVRDLDRHVRYRPDHDVIVYEGEAWSYREFHDLVGGLAAALRADGVGPGDRVAYAGLNSVTFLAGYFASAWVGAAFVPLNFRLAGLELLAILLDARPDVLIAEPDHAAVIDSFVDDISVRCRLVVDDDASASVRAQTHPNWRSFRDFRTSAADPVSPVSRDEDDLALLLYTSGTTGKPKGVMLSHGNVLWNWINVDGVVDTRFGDVTLSAAPLFHIGGLNALTLRTIARGGTVILRRSFDPAQALDDLVNYKVNSTFVVAAMLAAIQRQPGFDDADLSELRSTIAAGAPVPPALIASYGERGVNIQQAWGLTETAPFATYLEAGKTTEKLGSCGAAMPYGEVKVVDPFTLDDLDVADAVGELWVRGPNVSKGYWNNPEATAAAFTADGWFRTGDIGYCDADGYFYIVDRMKDMIITGGENVYPAEIENALNAHPDIVDVAVVGVPDERWGEAVCAVVKATDAGITLEEVRDFAATFIARYKLPTRLVLRDEVARNGSGKLDKPRIRAEIADDSALSS